MNYLRKFPKAPIEVCELLRKLITRVKWMWNRYYQNLYEKVKSIIKAKACIKFYNKKEALYLKMDASGVGLEAGLLQVRDRMWFCRNEAPDNVAMCPIAFGSLSFTSAEMRYSNIEREARGILHGFKPLLPHPQDQHNNRPQTIDGKLQEGYSNPVTKASADTAVHLPQ